MCIVINLYGGPGTGKSTIAAGLYAAMKIAGEKVELVQEYAKDLTYEGRHNILEEDQLYIFAKQHRRMKRLHDHVDYIITDSPLFLSVVYGEVFDTSTPAFIDIVLERYHKYENINIFIKRDLEHHPYQEYGRNQNEKEAIAIDKSIWTAMDQAGLPYHLVKFHKTGMIQEILNIIKEQKLG